MIETLAWYLSFLDLFLVPLPCLNEVLSDTSDLTSAPISPLTLQVFRILVNPKPSFNDLIQFFNQFLRIQITLLRSSLNFFFHDIGIKSSFPQLDQKLVHLLEISFKEKVLKVFLRVRKRLQTRWDPILEILFLLNRSLRFLAGENHFGEGGIESV